MQRGDQVAAVFAKELRRPVHATLPRRLEHLVGGNRPDSIQKLAQSDLVIDDPGSVILGANVPLPAGATPLAGNAYKVELVRTAVKRTLADAWEGAR